MNVDLNSEMSDLCSPKFANLHLMTVRDTVWTMRFLREEVGFKVGPDGVDLHRFLNVDTTIAPDVDAAWSTWLDDFDESDGSLAVGFFERDRLDSSVLYDEREMWGIAVSLVTAMRASAEKVIERLAPAQVMKGAYFTGREFGLNRPRGWFEDYSESTVDLDPLSWDHIGFIAGHFYVPNVAVKPLLLKGRAGAWRGTSEIADDPPWFDLRTF